MEPIEQTTTQPPGETPERNGIGTYLSLAILALTGGVTLIATIVGDGSAASDSATIGAIFAGLAVVGKYAQAVAKIITQARPAVEALDGQIRTMRRGVALGAAMPALTRETEQAFAGGTQIPAEQFIGNFPPADVADQSMLAAVDGDLPGPDGDHPTSADVMRGGPALDDLPGGVDAPPADDESGAVR